MAARVGPCKLCQQIGPLRDSHVLSELTFGPTYKGPGTDHWTVGLWRDRHGVLKPRKVQKGLREPLLCGDCEQLFANNYEQPSAPLWRHLASGEAIPHGVTAQHRAAPDGSEGTVFTGIDYRSFKLFLLSMLWRASVAEGGEWAGVSLGSKHEPILRQMLLQGNPGAQGDYPCVTYLLKETARMIAPPSETRMDSHRAYLFHINNVVLVFLTSSHLPELYKAFGIHPSGALLTVYLNRLDDVPGMQGIRQMVSEIGDLPDSMT